MNSPNLLWHLLTRKTKKYNFLFFYKRGILKKILCLQGQNAYEFPNSVSVKTLGDAPTSDRTSADGPGH